MGHTKPCQFTLEEDVVYIEVTVSAADFSEAMLLEQLHAAGYGRSLLLKDQQATLLLEYKQIQIDIQRQVKSEGVLLRSAIAARKPAVLTVNIASDAMSVDAEIMAAFGGTPISANDVVKAAQNLGVTFGFYKEQILTLVSQASRAEPGDKVRATIALGREPVPGKDSVFEAMILDMGNRLQKPIGESQGKVDLRDFGSILSVKEGELLMQRHPPTKGTPGMTTTGQLLHAPDGKEIAWGAAQGAAINPTNANQLIATQDGMPRVLDTSVCVDEVFEIGEVDGTTGHIIFKGAVLVHGDVKDSMKVIAGGNVIIKGVFEGMLLESGGDVSIAGAAIGRQLTEDESVSYSTIIRAKGNIECTLAQYTQLECEGMLHASKQLSHCQVSAAEVLVGALDKINGKVIGGHFSVGRRLRCGELGAPSGSQVKISLNRWIDPLLEKQSVLKTTLLALKAEMKEIKEQIERLAQMERTLAVQEQLIAMAKDFEEQRKIATAFIADIKQLEENRRQLLGAVGVEAKLVLFNGVECHIGQESNRSRREYGPSVFRLTSEGVQIEALL